MARKIQGLLGQEIEVDAHKGNVHMAGGSGPAYMLFQMTPEQAREAAFILHAAAEMANDHRALQQQVQRPDLATQVAMGELT